VKTWFQNLLFQISNLYRYDQGHQLDQLGLRDKAWGINKLAGTARRHRMGEVANAILTKQQGHIEVQEAFSKLREQSKACLEMEGETVTGLNALEGTSLDFFHAHHKAELFRLKGQFQERMGDGDGAHASYATSLSLCKQLSKAWISWGEFCSRQATQSATAGAAAAAAAVGGSVAVAAAGQDEDGARWVEYSATCYLQAAKHGPQRYRHELVNVLHLLAFSEHTNAVGRALAKHLDAIQRWVWIPFVPQLLLSLLNREAPHAKALLLRLAVAHPQGMYCPLRTFLLERREAATRVTQTARQLAAKAQESAAAAQKLAGEATAAAAGAAAGAPEGGTAAAGGAGNAAAAKAAAQAKLDKSAAQSAAQAAGEATVAFDGAKEVMERLRHKHSHLVTELEVLLSELGARFASSPEERLLVVVYTLLHRCYKYPTATTAEVPASFKKELTGVCRACFSADTSTKHADFVAEYKADYERDLDPEQPTFPKALHELIDRLKRWKRALQSDVEDRLPTKLRLEDESPALRGMRFVEVEVPGQYSGDAELTAVDRLVKLERIGADVHVVRRHGSSYRCLTFLGADGSERRFLVQTSLTPAARGEERMLQLLRSLNASLGHHIETRRRGLCYYTPAVVPVWPQVRLMEDDAAHGTYGEVYEVNCARYGREADLPISLFKTALNDAVTGKVQGAEAVLDLRLKAFSDITQHHVTENIFSQFMYKTLPTVGGCAS
jgi:transformation/transcription domain-associated protein